MKILKHLSTGKCPYLEVIQTQNKTRGVTSAVAAAPCTTCGVCLCWDWPTARDCRCSCPLRLKFGSFSPRQLPNSFSPPSDVECCCVALNFKRSVCKTSLSYRIHFLLFPWTLDKWELVCFWIKLCESVTDGDKE